MNTKKSSHKTITLAFLGLIFWMTPASLNALSFVPSLLKSLSGLAQVTVFRGKKQESFDAVLLLQSPNQVRIEVLDDWGQVQFRLIADGQRVWYWDAKQRKFRTIKQNRKALKKILRLPISIEAFVRRILNFSPQSYPKSITWQFKSKLKVEIKFIALELNPIISRLKFEIRAD